MSSSICLAVAACFACGVLCILPARAETGRVAFSGAVVVPTCAAQADPGNTLRRRLMTCGGHPQAVSRQDDASVYALSVAHLGGETIIGSPLLQYFAGYLASAHAADAQVVTRTYE